MPACWTDGRAADQFGGGVEEAGQCGAQRRQLLTGIELEQCRFGGHADPELRGRIGMIPTQHAEVRRAQLCGLAVAQSHLGGGGRIGASLQQQRADTVLT